MCHFLLDTTGGGCLTSTYKKVSWILTHQLEQDSVSNEKWERVVSRDVLFALNVIKSVLSTDVQHGW